jgi:uncharacterized caspase-like protein
MRCPAILFALALAFLSTDAMAEKRVALVIGNSAYQHVPQLRNPRNDASDIAGKLRGLGFDVVAGTDLDLNGTRNVVRDFVERLDGADVALFFYAGHGLQVNGENYIAPVDARLGSVIDLDFEAVPMNLILSAMERATPVNLIFLDACRDNPLAENLSRSMGTRSASVGRGLARLGTGIGSLIAFSTQPGNVALDGEGRNSPFTSALLRHLGTPGEDITRNLIRVRRDVLEATGGKQVPWDNSSLTGEVILEPETAPERQATQSSPSGSQADPSDAATAEVTFWNSIKDSRDAAYFSAYLRQFPQGQFIEIAKLRIGEIEGTRGASKPAAPQAAKPGAFDKSKLDGLDPSRVQTGQPGTEKPGPEALELALNLTTEEIGKVQDALQLFGYPVGKENGQLTKVDRSSLRKFQIRNRIAETGYLDQASLEKLIDEVASIPKDYGGTWIINFHRYQYGPEDRSGVNLRTLMATATAELRDGEFYIKTSQSSTSKQSPFDTFSGTLAKDGQFRISITMDTLFDDEGDATQVVKATASEKLPKMVAYNQPIYIRGSRLWLNRKKGEDVSLRIELIRVRQ